MTSIAAALIGESPGMLAAFKTVARVADSTAPVLIQGETGTGKELLARVIHESSGRRQGPFVTVDCATLPDHHLEAELFGREAGVPGSAAEPRVGHFERASGGTFFLDSVDRASPLAQAKILGALQAREVERVGGERAVPLDVRVVAATTRDLQPEVTAGHFREDLYYLLAVVSVHLPPLRERGDDIRLLAEHCIGHFARVHDRPALAISRETLAMLLAYPWPGNIPELRDAMERAVLAADGLVIVPTNLPEAMRASPAAYTRRERVQPALLSLDELERRHIQHILRATGGHLGRAASLLGIHRRTLLRKIEEHGLPVKSSRTTRRTQQQPPPVLADAVPGGSRPGPNASPGADQPPGVPQRPDGSDEVRH